MRLSEDSSAEPGLRSDASIVVTILGLVLVICLGAVSALLVWDAAWETSRAEAEAEAARSATEIATRVADAVDEVDAAAVGRRAVPSGDVTLGVLEPGEVPSGIAPEVIQDESVRTALARARDTATMVMSSPTRTEPASVVIVRPLYRRADGDGFFVSPDESTAERRELLTRYAVGVVHVDRLLPEEGSDHRVVDGDTVLAGPSSGTFSAAQDVRMFDRRWEVTAPVARPASDGLLLVLGLTVAAALAVALAFRSWRRAVLDQAEAALRARHQAEAVITYAGVVQESHDLGEVIPAVAVQLSDRLDLAGVSVSVAIGDGGSREIFVFGEAPERAVEPAHVLPTAVAGGDTVAVHLRRAERSIGVLRVRSGRGLDPADLDQLRIAAELMTSTVVASRSLEQQQDAVDRLRALDELKTAFLGTASHELRTPVTAISGFAFMLSERWDTLSEQDRKVFADRIASNSRTLDALVQDLLDFARLERGSMQLVLEEVDLAGVADRVLDRLAPVWSDHVIERQIEPETWIVGDVPAIERVITNLVSNAVKFSPAGSTVAVRVEGDGRVRLVVDDQGPGVPALERERIFVRFFRGVGEAVVRTSGVGIGLSVVKDFVSQMGGQIDVEDNPTGGARFVVSFDRVEAPVNREERDVAST